MVRSAVRRLAATLLAVVVASACGASQAPIQPTPVPEPPPPNNAPQILSLTLDTNRAEVGHQVTIMANVTDDETLAANLKYEWTATAGTVASTGNVAVWTAPTSGPTPVVHRISLTVVEAYGSEQSPQEHRVTAESPEIYVDDSPSTVQRLVEEFLRDFSNSSVSPETCLRNFSDSCPGKERERRDIVNNRNVYFIQSSEYSISRVTFNSTLTRARVIAHCKFRSTIKATGASEVADGDCDLQLIHQDNRWWLCESSYHGLNAAGLKFIF